jgi:flagellin-like hook-associated protein FlgL
MASITLSAGVRQNLLALQNTTALQTLTQNRLATGKKVNSALDNPVNFFTSAALSARAGELTNLLDSMTNGINTVKAADNGLTSITTTIQTMQATVTQARQDASWKSTSYTYDAARTAVAADKLAFTNGAVGATAVNVSINTATKTSAFAGPVVLADNGKQFTISNGTTTTGNITLATADTVDGIVTKITAALTTAGLNSTITAANVGGFVKLTNTLNDTITVADGGVAGGAAVMAFAASVVAAKTLDQIVTDVNGNASLTGKVKASNDAGTVRITNLSTADLTVAGVTAAGAIDGLAVTGTIGANSVRANLVTQFNQLRDQLDKTADDASFNGVNLLKGDAMKLFFNELSTSTLTIQSTDTNGINNTTLGITAGTAAEFQDNTQLDTRLQGLHDALTTVRGQSSAFGSNLSIVQNRQDFTNNMINTLQIGSDGLTLADVNQEGANMLALQTRQQLSVTALSLASQAQQAVLRLFG